MKIAMGLQVVVTLCVGFASLSLANGQAVQEIVINGVAGRDKCFQCCTDLQKDDATLLIAACQTGCDNNIKGIDQGEAEQVNSFNAGSNFNRIGTTIFGGNTYVCSQGGSTQQVFQGLVGEAECQTCCSSLNNNFDVNGEFSVVFCNAACVDGFADDCADFEDADEQDGCSIGVLFKQEIGANFFNADHFCSDAGVLTSLQAIEVSLVDAAEVVQANECSLCCEELADETNVEAADCSLGCNPTTICADDAAVEEDCLIGVSLATTSIAQIEGGSEITCLSPGVIERFINLDELAIELNDEEIATVVGGTVGYAALIALIGYAVYRRRSRRSRNASGVERGILDGRNDYSGNRFMTGISTNFKSMAQGFGGMVSTFRSPQPKGYGGEGATTIGYEMEESISSPGRRGGKAAAPGTGKGEFLGRFRRGKGNANSAVPPPGYDEPKQKRGILGRFRKKPAIQPQSNAYRVNYQDDRYNGYGGQKDDYGGRNGYQDDSRDFDNRDQRRNEAYGPIGGAAPLGGHPPRGGPPPMGGVPPSRGPRGNREEGGRRERRRDRQDDYDYEYDDDDDDDRRGPRHGRERDGGHGRRREDHGRQRKERDRGHEEGGQRKKRKKRRSFEEGSNYPPQSSKLRAFSNQ